MLPLARAHLCRADVVAFATGCEFVAKLETLGFPTYTAGMSIGWAEDEAIRRDPGLAALSGPDKSRVGQAIFSEVLPPRTAVDLAPAIEAFRPDLVIYEMGDLGAAVAAVAAGVPCAVHTYGCPWPDFMAVPMRRNMKRLWCAHGFDDPPVDEFHGDVYIDIAPRSLGDGSALPARARLVLRPTAFSEPADLPAWITEARSKPLAYVTLGTVVFERVDVIRAAVDGLVELGFEIVVAVGPDGSIEALGTLPAGVHAERFVPQDRLLPHVDVLVHHCGSGTMLGGLAQGIPQVVLPLGADQFVNAGILSEAGAAIALMPGQVSREAVSAAVALLLGDPAYRRAAERIRDEIAAMASPENVADELRNMFGHAG